MSCNCNKDKIELSIKKKLRRTVKEKIADLKKIWEDSKTDGENIITTNKRNLNFK